MIIIIADLLVGKVCEACREVIVGRIVGRIPGEKTPDEDADVDEETGEASCCLGDAVWSPAVVAVAAAATTAVAAAADWRKVRPKVISESA